MFKTIQVFWRIRLSLFGRKAIDQAVAAGLFQVILTTAACSVRRVPGRYSGRFGLAVVVADLGLPRESGGIAGGPIPASHVLACRIGHAVELRTGQNVVLVRLVAASVHLVPFFVQRSFLVDIDLVRVQAGDVIRDLHSLGVVPGTFANAITGIHSRLAIFRAGTQVGAPGAVARFNSLSQLLAVRVGSLQSTEISAIARSFAGDEKTHRRFLVLGCTRSHTE